MSYSFMCVWLIINSIAVFESKKGRCHFCFGDEEKIDLANDATTEFLGLPCCDSCYLEIVDLKAKIMDILVKDGFFEDQRYYHPGKEQLV